MTDDWDLIGFVVSSRYRTIVIHELNESPSTPSQIAERLDAYIASISHSLSELRERDCVELLVDEDRRKGRVYGLTETGEAIWEDLEEQQLVYYQLCVRSIGNTITRVFRWSTSC